MKEARSAAEPLSLSSTSRFDMRKSVEVQVDSDFALLLPSGAYEIKKMEPRRRLRSIVFICLVLAVAGIIGFGYFCPDQVISKITINFQFLLRLKRAKSNILYNVYFY